MRNLLPRIGFIDETSLKTNMAKTAGWSPRGARLTDYAPFGHWNCRSACKFDPQLGVIGVQK